MLPSTLWERLLISAYPKHLIQLGMITNVTLI